LAGGNMKKFMIYVIALLVVSIATTALAKRIEPKPVHPEIKFGKIGYSESFESPFDHDTVIKPRPAPPVIKDGIEYSAPSDHMGFVVAKWIKTNREIWSKQIYVVKYEYKYGLEEDAQWCFIKSLKLEGNQLIITNEEGSTFSLDIDTLQTKTIKGSNVIDHTNWKHPSERE
jgi:hypothetical protein